MPEQVKRPNPWRKMTIMKCIFDDDDNDDTDNDIDTYNSDYYYNNEYY